MNFSIYFKQVVICCTLVNMLCLSTSYGTSFDTAVHVISIDQLECDFFALTNTEIAQPFAMVCKGTDLTAVILQGVAQACSLLGSLIKSKKKKGKKQKEILNIAETVFSIAAQVAASDKNTKPDQNTNVITKEHITLDGNLLQLLEGAGRSNVSDLRGICTFLKQDLINHLPEFLDVFKDEIIAYIKTTSDIVPNPIQGHVVVIKNKDGAISLDEFTAIATAIIDDVYTFTINYLDEIDMHRISKIIL